ncbi:MAG: hypothetical protein II628_13810, partial [Lachnospiraceae bacterium]|nr:hypothetical protein [Lachnospiraceae bacterium]
VLHEDGSYTYGGDHGEWSHDRNFCVDGLFYPDRRPSAGAKIIRFIYRPIRVSYLSGGRFRIFNTTAFSEGSRYELTFDWNDGTSCTVIPGAGPLSEETVEIPLGKQTDGSLMVLVTARDTKRGDVVSEEEIVIRQTAGLSPETEKLPDCCSLADGKAYISLGSGQIMTDAPEPVLLYRAATDNDTDATFGHPMDPWYDQRQELVSSEITEKGCRNVFRIENRKAKFLMTETWEGTKEGILVTCCLHCTSGRGNLPRFGRSFRLDKAFDLVEYTGRCGESYCDMKDQFPIRKVSCRVADMTEPNIRPQESGNRCDCTEASVSDGKVRVTFQAVDRPFELGIKPYTDRALTGMKHREDEVRTGTYVTIQRFQQGIGTGACGPGIMPEYTYSVKKDYALRFLIRIETL